MRAMLSDASAVRLLSSEHSLPAMAFFAQLVYLWSCWCVMPSYGGLMRVLIVDDEVNIRSTMSKFFAIEDIDSDGAENGLSAQRMLGETAYDAVLVDLRMPGMDGLTLIRWIRAQGYRMPVIMISAHGDITDAVSALKEGAQDYIIKPFDPEELCIKIKSLVESSNLRNIVENAKANEEENAVQNYCRAGS